MARLVLSVLFFGIIMVGCTDTKSKSSKDYDPRYQVFDGDAVSVVLFCSSTTLIANGMDKAHLRLSLHTIEGMEVLSANNIIKLIVDGDAEIKNSDGEIINYKIDSDGSRYIETKLVAGGADLYLIAGNTPGKVKLTAMSEKLWHGGHEIHTVPADFKILKPSETQLPETKRNVDKMIGADISWLPELEAKGEKFWDEGKNFDGIELLKKHGFNYVRLRIFVNPEHEKGYSPGEGYCDLEHTLIMAKRVKDEGMKLLLDFHYSDNWADPQKQFKPSAWEGLSDNDLKDTVETYTYNVLMALKKQNTMPDMVQVGNEINHGMIWPNGHISKPNGLAGLLKAGISGVRLADPNIPVMVHIATGGLNKESVFWYDNMISRGVEFDVIGVSYYPRWHGTLVDLEENLNDLISRYNKPVNIVEYSWLKKEVHDVVFNLPDKMGRGAAIWEPLGWGEIIIDEFGSTNEYIKIYNTLSRNYLSD